MKSFFCYLHRASSMTPELRVVTAPAAGLSEALRNALPGWPDFEVVEVYDEYDKAVLRLNRDREITTH